MGFSTVVFIFGAVLLALGLLGEGVSIKDISIPRIPKASRFVFILLGALFVFLGLGLGVAEMQPDSPSVVQPVDPSGSDSPGSSNTGFDTSSTAAATPDEEPFREQVRAQLMSAGQYAITNDFVFQESSVDKLTRGEKGVLNLTLNADNSYALLAVCDQDCRDIDLLLYDYDGNLVVSDRESDDYPVVTFDTEMQRAFQLQVDIPNCGADYCFYGVSLFRYAG